MGMNLFDKVWDPHAVGPLADGQTQLFVGPTSSTRSRARRPSA